MSLFGRRTKQRAIFRTGQQQFYNLIEANGHWSATTSILKLMVESTLSHDSSRSRVVTKQLLYSIPECGAWWGHDEPNKKSNGLASVEWNSYTLRPIERVLHQSTTWKPVHRIIQQISPSYRSTSNDLVSFISSYTLMPHRGDLTYNQRSTVLKVLQQVINTYSS